MNKDRSKNKMSKVAKSTGIIVKIVLVLGGIAIMFLFSWLGLSIYNWAIGGAV